MVKCAILEKVFIDFNKGEKCKCLVFMRSYLNLKPYLEKDGKSEIVGEKWDGQKVMVNISFLVRLWLFILWKEKSYI